MIENYNLCTCAVATKLQTGKKKKLSHVCIIYIFSDLEEEKESEIMNQVQFALDITRMDKQCNFSRTFAL